jgi:hypothetical protein
MSALCLPKGDLVRRIACVADRQRHRQKSCWMDPRTEVAPTAEFAGKFSGIKRHVNLVECTPIEHVCKHNSAFENVIES